MPIERLGKDGWVATGPSVKLVKLKALHAMLELEVKGIRFRSSAAAAVRALLPSKTRHRRRLLIELEIYIAEHETALLA